MIVIMRQLTIPNALLVEFETVIAVWNSQAETRGVDALLLSWVKYEKQLRRLFCFLVFQHNRFSKEDIDNIISILVERYDLSPEVFRYSIDGLGCKSITELLGEAYVVLSGEMDHIRQVRNKLMHGQITGRKIGSPELEKYIQLVINWIAALASAAQMEFGYDCLQRNTFFHAKRMRKIAVQDFPFQTTDELRDWLLVVIKKVKKAENAKRK